MKRYNFFVYIITNKNKKVLYVGVTNDIERRLSEHYFNAGNKSTFAGRYNCHYLLYFEQFQYVNDALAREKEMKGWLRKKKVALINSENPEWKFLNNNVMEWPPKDSSASFHSASE